jgi:branched-chain amino acid transport system substrate-binding protein
MMHRAGGRRKPVAWPLLLGLGALVAAGCPSRFDPRAEPLQVSSSDPAARLAYHDARAQLDAGQFVEARRLFHDFRGRFPEDALVPSATLWEARADLGTGDSDGAKALVEPLANRPGENDPVAERARFLLGLALARSTVAADAEKARSLLQPFVANIANGEDAVELHASIAAACATMGDLPAALAEYAIFYSSARPAERDYIRAHTAELAGKLDDAQVNTVFTSAPRDGLACALLGGRVAELRRAQGDESGARAAADEGRAARHRFGFDGGGEKNGPISDLAVGLVLPLSGRNRLLGERALRGALLAAEALPSGPSTVELRVRDDESSPEKAAAAVAELGQSGVVAIIGSPDRSEGSSAAAAADAAGLPFLTLAPDETHHGALTFKLLRPNPARAEALAKRANELGANRIATLYPDSAYGKKMNESFTHALGKKTVAELSFDEKSTTFIAQAKQLAKTGVDAIFVPAPATQLELVAAQLAATGITKTQGGTQKRQGALLLATADGVTPKFIASAGRYVQGAVLAPVFYADAADANLAPFVEKFRASYGDEPGAADALAFDAVTAVKLALTRLDPARGRAGLAALVASGRDSGVTGTLGFGATGERAGSPQLFIVDGDAIKAMR